MKRANQILNLEGMIKGEPACPAGEQQLLPLKNKI
jgi:hypothetical protein